MSCWNDRVAHQHQASNETCQLTHFPQYTGIDGAQSTMLGQGEESASQQKANAAVDQAEDEQIGDFIRDKYVIFPRCCCIYMQPSMKKLIGAPLIPMNADLKSCSADTKVTPNKTPARVEHG